MVDTLEGLKTYVLANTFDDFSSSNDALAHGKHTIRQCQLCW